MTTPAIIYDQERQTCVEKLCVDDFVQYPTRSVGESIWLYQDRIDMYNLDVGYFDISLLIVKSYITN